MRRIKSVGTEVLALSDDFENSLARCAALLDVLEGFGSGADGSHDHKSCQISTNQPFDEHVAPLPSSTVSVTFGCPFHLPKFDLV